MNHIIYPDGQRHPGSDLAGKPKGTKGKVAQHDLIFFLRHMTGLGIAEAHLRIQVFIITDLRAKLHQILVDRIPNLDSEGHIL